MRFVLLTRPGHKRTAQILLEDVGHVMAEGCALPGVSGLIG
jgi:hypothetical protein